MAINSVLHWYLCNNNYLASFWENRSSGFPTTWSRSDTKRAELHVSIKMARDLEFRILNKEGFYYLCSVNKVADQLCGYRTLFSHLQKSGSYNHGEISPGVRKPTMWILIRSDTNQAVQPLEMARGLKFCI